MIRFSRSSAIAMVLIGAVVFGAPASAKAGFTLSISSDTNASIRFAGDSTFSFPNTGAHDFSVTASTGVGDSVNLHGDIAGTYTIGAITNSGTTHSATVTGVGAAVSIFDGVRTFSATIDWMDITQRGTGSTLNIDGLVNLSSAIYTGTNADLQELTSGINAHTGSAVLSFTFNPAIQLAVLKNGPGAHSTGYSGTLTTDEPAATPAPASVVLAFSAFASLGGFSLLRRRKGIVAA